MYKRFVKRLIDLVLSFFGIIVLALPMFIIAIAIKLDSKGPVFFKQNRIGLHKKHFNILKFRTMRTDTPHDAPTHQLEDPKKWITKVGGLMSKNIFMRGTVGKKRLTEEQIKRLEAIGMVW